MRRFLVKTLLFSLPILLIATLMEILLQNIPNDYVVKKQYLDKHSSEIETLILGSSHSFYGIDPSFFSSNTFNASFVSQTLDYDYEILKAYQAKLTSLKTIVLPISVFSLFFDLEKSPEAWRQKNYIIYYKFSTGKSFKEHSEVLGGRTKVNLLRIISYYIKRNPTVASSPLGWGRNYTSITSKNLEKTGKSAALRHSGDFGLKDSVEMANIFKKNLTILDSIVNWSSKRNIKLLLLTPPAYISYRQNLNQRQLNLTTETVEKIVAGNSNCVYLNLLSDSDFVAKDFYDADHLSEIGAKKLSKLIDFKISHYK